MTPVATLVSAALLAFARLPPEELLRRGYELLPDARWREELERDRDSDFLGMVLPSPTHSGSSPIELDFTELEYDRKALHPLEVRRVRVDLKSRPLHPFWRAYHEIEPPRYAW